MTWRGWPKCCGVLREVPPHPFHALRLRRVHDELRAVNAQVTRSTLRKRIQRGWPLEEALSRTPSRRMRQSHRREVAPPCPYFAALAEWRLPAGYLEPGVRGNVRVGL